MDPPQDASAESPNISSPEILSPGGRSRYGRTRRPKVSQDFYNIDDVIIDENPPPRRSPLKSPKLKPPPKSPIIRRDVVFEIKDEFTKLDDLGTKVANNFKANLQRGLDDTIKERKFFKSLPESKSDVVDVTKVFKLIAAKPTIPDAGEGRTPPKTALKTYSNKRKHLHDSDSFIVESFGLPDEPIIPVKSPLEVQRDRKIDVDANCDVDVNLANPWTFEEFDPVPLYASEPVVEQFGLKSGLDLFACDSLLGGNTDIVITKCQSTNFEKSRIPTPLQRSDSEVKCDKKGKEKSQGTKSGRDKKRALRNRVEVKNKERDKVVLEKDTECCKFVNKSEDKVTEVLDIKIEADVKDTHISNSSENNNQNAATIPEITQQITKTKKNATKVLNKKISPLKKKRKLEDSPTRILRSSIDNNNEVKKDNLSSLEESESIHPTAIISKTLKCKDQVINPIKVSQTIHPPKVSKTVHVPQVKVILNPLACAEKILAGQLPNPFKSKSSKSPTKDVKSGSTEGVSQAIIGFNRQALKKNDNGLKKSPEKKVHIEEFDVTNIKTERVEFEVGDLAWAKIGTHPYWPCMVTQEPISGDHKRCIVNRIHPLYHVQFFGDNGRRSWVSAQYVMLFYGCDDLDKLAKILRAENKVKASYIRQSFEIRSAKLPMWQSGVDEAESLKSKTVQERLDFFIEVCAKKRQRKQKVKENLDDEENSKRKRSQLCESVNSAKRIKTDVEETKSEDLLIGDLVEIKKEQDEADAEEIVVETHNKSDINGIKSPDGNKKIVKKISPASTSPDARKKLRSQYNLETFASPERLKKKSETVEETIMRSPEQRRRLRSKSASVTNEETDSDDTKKSEEVKTPVLEVRKKFVKKEEFSEENLEARKKLRNFQIKAETVKTPQEPRKESTEAPKPVKRISVEEEEPKLRNKRHQIGGEYSNSDTDSKFSDNSSVPTSLESQAALYRRNNIFRGIPKDKVCQICEEAGEVFKCKGPCNGVYHYKCATKQDKKEGEVESNVEIVGVDANKPLPQLGDAPNYKGMSLAEKIDFRMKEIMKKFDHQSAYAESTDSSSDDIEEEKVKSPSKLALTVTNKPTKKEVPIIKHVTADHVSYICVTSEQARDEAEAAQDTKAFKCMWCATEETPRCLICNSEESKAGSKFRQKCSLHQCGKYYHPECLKVWPQTQWSLIQSTKDKKSDATYDTFVCPRHVCHTCISDDPRAANSRCPSDKVVKCLRCPATYHTSSYCVPAGTHILSTSQVVCPRHYSNLKSAKRRMQQTINANWCFICSKGGNLICCETCPTSVHAECLPGDLNKDDTFFCEDCQSGRLPLYDEIVWVKLGTFRWWPALILFPNEVPDNVRNIAHNRGEFVVKFFGTYDHYWVGRGRTFLFQEGDKGHSSSARKRVDNAFVKAIEEAAAAHQLKKQFKLNKVAEKNSGLKPPPYIRIKVNKPVGNVRLFDGNISNTTSCECDPNQPHPCGPDSDCLNRLLLTECNPQACPAGERCNNQCFEKREYPPLVPHRTQVRGWGLKTLAPIRKGQFVIEYVGEIIDEQEYQRRIQKMHEQKEENYYFLTIDKDRTLDAGPKGNVARFMNHSCDPNCETQKWTVNGDTRVGLFATCDIPADTELTFNYNLECIGKEKKICKCGAMNCSGFIGGKMKTEGTQKKSTKPKKKKTPPPEIVDNENPCFICGTVGDVGACNNKMCTKYYHLKCVGLESWPEGGKWVCQWHNCNICSKRTIRCCLKCVNSYCPPHSEGYVRYDKSLPGFICFEHDPSRALKADAERAEATAADDGAEKPERVAKESEVDATKPDDDFESCMRMNGCVTSTPMRKSKEESSLDESAVSSDVSETKSRRKKANKRMKTRSLEKVDVESKVKNTANLFNSVEKEVKLTKFTPVRHLRTSTRILNKTDPDKDLPIRKRKGLRCGDTL